VIAIRPQYKNVPGQLPGHRLKDIPRSLKSVAYIIGYLWEKLRKFDRFYGVSASRQNEEL